MILRLDYVILSEVKRSRRISSLGVPLSAVYTTRRSLDRLGMTFIVSVGIDRD